MSYKRKLGVANMGTNGDDKKLTVIRNDFSEGINNRQDADSIRDNQAETLVNVDIGVPGQSRKRPGITSIDDTGYDRGIDLFGFEPDGGTSKLMAIEISGTATALLTSTGLTFAPISGTANMVDDDYVMSMQGFKSGGDGHVMLYGSDTTNWHEVKQNGTVTDLGNTQASGTDDPPRSSVATMFNGRMWVLKDNMLSYSDAYPGDFSGAFDTQSTGNVYKMPVGEERALVGIREKGLLVFGKDEVRYLIPSNTPAATDENGLLVTQGCVANKSATMVGDDVYYLAKDGVRGVFKTQFDTLQLKTSLPVSYALKTEYESINWAHAQKASGVYFDNKYFLALPVDSSTYNNEVWVYYPATNGWMVITGWNVADWTTIVINGENRLYASDSQSGDVYRAWYGSDDNGADFTYTEKGRKEEIGKSLQEKVGGEVIVRAKATGEETIKVYVSLDESAYEKLGELVTVDRSVAFDAWTLPMLFQPAGIYTKKFHLDSYGEWYQAQIKLEHEGTAGDDLIILQRGIVTLLNEYTNEEDE